MQGVGSSKSAGFSLSNGDFPTLGSEKDNAGRNTQSQGVHDLFEIVAQVTFSFVPWLFV